jgi:tetratricopeptide (TPR) repeat protein
MKRLDTKNILWVWALVLLVVSGCAKEQPPKLEDAEAYNNRGLTYFDRGQYAWAISDYSKAIEIDPRYAAAYSNRGDAYKITGQYDKAISDFSKVIEINPKLSVFYYLRGNVYLLKKEYDNTWSDYKKAQELGFKIPPKMLEKLREVSGREK